MTAYRSTFLAPVLLLAATACGAPGGSANDGAPSGGSSVDPSAYPSALLGTWQGGEGEFADIVLKFSADGTCVQKDAGYPADPCTFSVSTGGVNSPSTSQSWIVQVSSADYGQTLEVVAIDPNQFTVRDGQRLYNYTRVSGDNAKDCVGPDVTRTCDEFGTQQGCNNTPGCFWDGSCGGAYACDEIDERQYCTSDIGCSWIGKCYGDATSCIEVDAEDCNTYPACHLQ